MTMTRTLRCELTPAEKDAKGTMLANILDEVEKLTAEKKASSEDYKSRIKLRTDRARDLAEDIRLGSERREIEVQEVRDERRGEVQIRRLDTGEVIDHRAMTAEERQAELPILGGEKRKSKRKGTLTVVSDDPPPDPEDN